MLLTRRGHQQTDLGKGGGAQRHVLEKRGVGLGTIRGQRALNIDFYMVSF